MFSMLEVIFRRDPVATQGFGAGQFQITLIISLGVLCCRAAEPGMFSFPEPGVSWHCVGHILHLGRGCAAAGLSSEVVFIRVRMSRWRKSCDVHWRSCRYDKIDGRIALTAAIKIDGCAGTLNSRRADPDRHHLRGEHGRRFQDKEQPVLSGGTRRAKRFTLFYFISNEWA